VLSSDTMDRRNSLAFPFSFEGVDKLLRNERNIDSARLVSANAGLCYSKQQGKRVELVLANQARKGEAGIVGVEMPKVDLGEGP